MTLCFSLHFSVNNFVFFTFILYNDCYLVFITRLALYLPLFLRSNCASLFHTSMNDKTRKVFVLLFLTKQHTRSMPCLLSLHPHTSFNPFPNKPWFLRVCSTSLLKTLWEKEKLLVTSNFSFSHSVFCPFEEHSAIFIRFQFVVCKLFQFGPV